MGSRPIITLLTDFGYKDHYVAVMKGVILSICPEANIVDITHGVPKFDIHAAAYLLRAAVRYFPPGSIHVAVVDPGVGTPRRGIVIKTRNHILVGPDNGVLALAATLDGIEEVRIIENHELTLPRISRTFHGRDIFAPVAAHLAKGVPLVNVGRRVDEMEVPSFAKPIVKGKTIEGEVLYVDDFGNVVLNIEEELLRVAEISYDAFLRVVLDSTTLKLKLLPSYGYAKEGEPLLLINSEGFLELAVNKGNAAEAFGLRPGTKVCIESVSSADTS